MVGWFFSFLKQEFGTCRWNCTIRNSNLDYDEKQILQHPAMTTPLQELNNLQAASMPIEAQAEFGLRASQKQSKDGEYFFKFVFTVLKIMGQNNTWSKWMKECWSQSNSDNLHSLWEYDLQHQTRLSVSCVMFPSALHFCNTPTWFCPQAAQPCP